MNNKLRLCWVLDRDAALICSGDTDMRNATLNCSWRHSSGSSRKTRESQLFGRDAILRCGPVLRPSGLWKDADS